MHCRMRSSIDHRGCIPCRPDWEKQGAVFFALMMIYQHSLVSPQDLSKVNIAFMTTNGLASIVYASLVIIDIISR